MYNTQVENVPELLKDCYKRQGESIRKMARCLGCSWEPIKKLMLKYDVKYYPKGGEPKKKTKVNTHP
jgi:hypothetical protein